jgi:hypothetical protein
MKIEDLSQLIRKAFIDETKGQRQARGGLIWNVSYTPPPRWEGGRDSSGKIHQPIWPRIAEFSLKNELDPLAHVRAQFDRSLRPPTPGFLLTDESLDRYRSQIASFEKELRFDCTVQLDRIHVEVSCLQSLSDYSELECWVSVLWGPYPELRPLCRYCIAVWLIQSHGQHPSLMQLKEGYRHAACLEFLGYPGLYRKILTDLIPKNLVKLHSRLRSSVAGDSPGQATSMCKTRQGTQRQNSSTAPLTPDHGVQRRRLSGALPDAPQRGTPRGRQ